MIDSYDAKRRAKIAHKALNYAYQCGWTPPALENAIFVKSRPYGLTESMLTWCKGLILTEEFAIAFFGKEFINNVDGQSFNAIRLWAKQVAVEHLDKLIKVDENKPYVELIKMPEISMDYDWPKSPAELIDVKRIVYKLRDMSATIPIRTHQLREVDVIGGIESYKFHLREMVLADDLFEYLYNYMEENKILPGWNHMFEEDE